MKSAEQVLLESIDELLATQDNDLVVPFSALNQAITDVVGKNAKVITKMASRILRDADRELTSAGDVLDSVHTRLLQGIDTYAWDQEYLLGHLSAKGGIIQPGDPLTAALLQQTADAPQLAYAGTLVLAVKEAVPWLERIATSLEVMATWIPQDSMQERINRLNGDDLLAGLLENQSTSQGSIVGVTQSTGVRLWQLEEVYGRIEAGISRAAIIGTDPKKLGRGVTRGPIITPQIEGSADPMQGDSPPQAWLDAAGDLLERYRRLVTPPRPDPFMRDLSDIFPRGFNPRMMGD